MSEEKDSGQEASGLAAHTADAHPIRDKLPHPHDLRSHAKTHAVVRRCPGGILVRCGLRLPEDFAFYTADRQRVSCGTCRRLSVA